MTSIKSEALAYRQPNGLSPRKAGDPLVLPPGVTSGIFHDFAVQAATVVGELNIAVITDEEELRKDHYADPSKAHDMFHLFDKDYFVVSAVIAPRKVTEVQSVVRLCNDFEIPLWTFSIGRNLGYGGAAPRVAGSIGLDLGRHMNNIIEVNEEGAYALVEPGVTFFDLYQYLVDNKLDDKLWIDTPDLGGGSVLGNTVDRGVGYTPYGGEFILKLSILE